MVDISISIDVLSALLPMHLCVDKKGTLLSCGKTLRRIAGAGDFFSNLFILDGIGGEGKLPHDAWSALASGERVFLRIAQARDILIRGQGMYVQNGVVFANFGFGSDLRAAVSAFSLTDIDFSPSDLAMEVLFLCEANGLLQADLAKSNEMLFSSRKEVEKLSIMDDLTGILNRRGFEHEFLKLYHGNALGNAFLICVDLDNFKTINDNYGHAVGDEILRKSSKIIKNCIGSGDLCGRIGGDEFIVLIRSSPHVSSVIFMVEQMISDIGGLIDLSSFHCKFSACVGVVDLRDFCDMEYLEMVRRADEALYDAKKNGKSSFRISGV